MKKLYFLIVMMILGLSSGIKAQDNFIGEVRIFAGNFPPKGWAFCDGQLMLISQNTALFSLLGTNYGGDGKTNFALPNLNGCTPIGAGGGPNLTPRYVGEAGGVDNVTLLSTEMAAHSHSVNNGSVAVPAFQGAGDMDTPVNSNQANCTKAYNTVANATMKATGVTADVQAAGGNQPHNNLQPYLVVRYIIALQGYFPPRS